jgi:hypothetical protein
MLRLLLSGSRSRWRGLQLRPGLVSVLSPAGWHLVLGLAVRCIGRLRLGAGEN